MVSWDELKSGDVFCLTLSFVDLMCSREMNGSLDSSYESPVSLMASQVPLIGEILHFPRFQSTYFGLIMKKMVDQPTTRLNQ